MIVKPGGEVWLQGDRAGRSGKYAIKNENVCVVEDGGERCYRFYSDEEGRMYLAGGEVSGPEPTMVRVTR